MNPSPGRAGGAVARPALGPFRLAFLVTGTVAAFWAVTGAPASPAAVGHLRVEYEETPLGMDVKTPRFSWQMAARPGERGVSQSAYQVEVKDANGSHGVGYGKVASARLARHSRTPEPR